MAQVYTFTDSNGEIRLMAEINPAPGGAQPFVASIIGPYHFAFDTPGMDPGVPPNHVALHVLAPGTLVLGMWMVATADWAIGRTVIAGVWNTVEPALDPTFASVNLSTWQDFPEPSRYLVGTGSPSGAPGFFVKVVTATDLSVSYSGSSDTSGEADLYALVVLP